jgi:hypothetical protein
MNQRPDHEAREATEEFIARYARKPLPDIKPAKDKSAKA